MKKIAARFAILGVIVALAVPVIISPGHSADAQGINLLRNGDFSSGGFYGVGGKGQVPVGWSTWANGEAPVNDCHQDPTNEGRVRSGPCAWVQRGAFVPFTGGGYQQVTGLTEGSTYRFTIWAFVWTCDDRVNSCIGANGRTSDRNSQARARIGVDPTGGTNANADTVGWSQFFTPWDAFGSQSLDIIAESASMTVFTYYTSSVPMMFNEIYWDDASLVELGEGEGNPANTGGDGEGGAPPAPAFVPFVEAQQARPDGSVVHVVGQDDTFSSIAVAYRDLASRDEILALNGWELPPAIITIGQEIKILPPGSVDPNTGRLLNQGNANATTTPASTPPPPPPPADDGGQGGPTPTPTSPPAPPPADSSSGGSGTGGSIGPRTPVIDPDVEKGGSLIPGDPSPSFFTRSYRTFKRPILRRASVRQENNRETGTVCVLFFEDQNSDAHLNRDEPVVTGGVFNLAKQDYTINDVSGQACIEVASGSQTIEAVAPAGYGFITGPRLELTVYNEKTITVDFGVMQGITSPDNPPTVVEDTDETVDTVTVITDTSPNDDNLGEQLIDNSAFIVFGLAALVGLFSFIIVWSYRR